MVTKTITITQEAYNYLKSLKGNKSFSETILALKETQDDTMQYAGSMKELHTNNILDARKQLNKELQQRTNK